MSMDHDKTTRREFLRTGAVLAGAAAVGSMPTTARAMSRILGANDRVHIGHIGVGTQGYAAHVRLINQASRRTTPSRSPPATCMAAVCAARSRS